MKLFFKPAALRQSLRVFLCLLFCFFKSCSAPATTPVMSNEPYLGLSEGVALEKARSAGVRARIISREGRPLRVTKDYRPDRLNFTISGGKVVRMQKG